METSKRTCCFTGHRDVKKSEYERLATAICSMIDTLHTEGFTEYICGGALGFDTVAAVTVINLKKLYPDIRLIIAKPCPEQASRWAEPDRALYQRILDRADEVVTVSPVYTRSCMLERNRYMVDRSEMLIAYVKRAEGGSAYTLRYAEKKGLDILNLADWF